MAIGIYLIIFKIKDKKLDLMQKILCLFFATIILIGKSFDTFGTLADRYIPQFADPVNLEFNYNATQEDINSFLKVWFKHFLKHPDCYLEAFINQNYTFYYPAPLSWYVYQDDLNTEELQVIIKLPYPKNREIDRVTQTSLAYVEYLYLPGIRYLLYNGTHFWILLIASYYIIKNNKKYITPILPLYLVFLVCLVGPSNWYRYSYQ